MPISVDNKLFSSLTPEAKRTFLVLLAGAGLVKEIAPIVKDVSPWIKMAINRAFDLATAKLALKYGRDPRDISNIYESSTEHELTAA